MVAFGMIFAQPQVDNFFVDLQIACFSGFTARKLIAALEKPTRPPMLYAYHVYALLDVQLCTP